MPTEGNSLYRKRAELEREAEVALKTECDSEISTIYETMSANQTEYDKQLLVLSSAFLALSVALIKDIVPIKQAVFRNLLYWSFIDLSVCILAVLASYQISIWGLRKAKAHYEDKKVGGNLDFPWGHATFIWIFNIFNGVLFFIGIVLMVSFVVLNLKESAMPQNAVSPAAKAPVTGGHLQEGANLKTPAPPPPPQRTPTATPKK